MSGAVHTGEARRLIGGPHVGEGGAFGALVLADTPCARVLAAPAALSADGEVAGAGSFRWPFQGQRADAAEREPHRLAAMAALDDPHLRAGRGAHAEAAHLAAPEEFLPGFRCKQASRRRLRQSGHVSTL